MRLSDHMKKSLVLIIQDAADKRGVLEKIVSHVEADLDNVDGQELLTRLIAREEQSSTGIGQGVAIPHATAEGLDKPYCIVAQIPKGIDYQSLDGSLVYLTFLLISPPRNVGSHLRLLARIARLVAQKAFIQQVVTAKTEDEIFSLVAEEDKLHV